jgi:hypothetical protein
MIWILDKIFINQLMLLNLQIPYNIIEFLS